MFFHSNDDQNYKINCLICKKENKGTINFRYFENQFIPAEILVNHLPENHETISSWLSDNAGFKITFKKPLENTV